jgi:hypothetical protein
MSVATKRKASKQKSRGNMQIPVREIIQVRSFENPLTTEAQRLHETDSGKSRAGWITAPVNLCTLMGGFYRFHGTKAQQEAAAKFKRLHDQSQLGASRAMDPSIEFVDGGGGNPEASIIIGADARREMASVREYLGRVQYRCAEFVIVDENGPTAYARFRARGERAINGQVVGRMQVEMRRIMDRLVDYWRLVRH